MTSRFLFAVLLVISLPSMAEKSDPCHGWFYECRDADDQLLSAQIYPCAKGQKQDRLWSRWIDPKDMEWGAFGPSCVREEGGCKPCQGVRWIAFQGSNESPPVQSNAPSSTATSAHGSDVRIGMSAAEVRTVWGQPKDIHKSARETSSGIKTSETWTYKKDSQDMPSFVSFRDGIVYEVNRGSRLMTSESTPTAITPETRIVDPQGQGCNGPLNTGPRGGRYYLGPSGNKVYCSQ